MYNGITTFSRFADNVSVCVALCSRHFIIGFLGEGSSDETEYLCDES